MGLKSPKKKEILALIFFLVYLPFSMLTEIDYIDKNSNTNQFYEKRNPEPNDNKLKTQGSVIDYYQKHCFFRKGFRCMVLSLLKSYLTTLLKERIYKRSNSRTTQQDKQTKKKQNNQYR